jgi:thioredoxin-related protein
VLYTFGRKIVVNLQIKVVKMIKSVLVLFLISGVFSFAEVNETVNWVSIEEAQEIAKNENKMIFIDFSAEWCGWCKVMDKNTFSDAEVAAFMNEKFSSVRLDYDSEETFEFFGEKYTARELGAKYKVPGLPTILLVSHDNKKSKTLVGYKKPEPFLSKLKSFNK